MELILLKHALVICLVLLVFFLAWCCEAQFTIGSNETARQLDSVLQDYAYRAFVRPRTGIPYDGMAPTNLSGIEVAVLRLRIGSLRTRGFKGYKEFDIPTGVIVQPYVKRLAFVYQNLGNWSSLYYQQQGFTYLAPVLGLLAYSAANLSATKLPVLDVVASGSPIMINFSNARPMPNEFEAKCVRFDLNGSTEFSDLISGNICSTFRQGHFSIVVNSTAIAPSPSLAPARRGKKHKSSVWKIVVSVIGGFGGLLLLLLLVGYLASHRSKKKFREMQKREDVGEVLQMEQVGNTRLPVAPMTRTQPVIENDYMP
ncbi:hypothetical protein HPP92_019760 [Vanilla planifolia]|uniref:Transmembrane protein n=1 Tax=Vanilla planifolia TaxID=51239 RepID=A0A835ULF2_VANPL|nr:hypothetical protein HPP92_019760 [Vanilla planifolia]